MLLLEKNTDDLHCNLFENNLRSKAFALFNWKHVNKENILCWRHVPGRMSQHRFARKEKKKKKKKKTEIKQVLAEVFEGCPY